MSTPESRWAISVTCAIASALEVSERRPSSASAAIWMSPPTVREGTPAPHGVRGEPHARRLRIPRDTTPVGPAGRYPSKGEHHDAYAYRHSGGRCDLRGCACTRRSRPDGRRAEQGGGLEPPRGSADRKRPDRRPDRLLSVPEPRAGRDG